MVSLRTAARGDLPRLVAAADRVFRPPPAGGSMGTEYPLLLSAENAERGRLVIADRGGEVVGHAGFCLRAAVLGDRHAVAACFGAVFVAPDLRGRGLGGGLVAEAVARARSQGAQVGLVSGAGPLYERAGFAPVSPARRYRIGRGAAAGEPSDRRAPVALSAAGPGAVEDLARLYDAEPVRFERPRQDWERLIAAGVLFYDPLSLFMVAGGDGASAYVAVARRVRHAPGEPRHRALEIAGDREPIAQAAPALLARLHADALDLIVPAHDASLEPFAAAAGWEPGSASFPHTAAVWDARLAGAPLPAYGLNYV
jgi:predicted N-acetyltransferase YhbS